MLYYEELFTKPSCCNCRSEIQSLGIQCSECSVKICTECFALGAEIGPHKKDHRYHFFDSGSLILFPASTKEKQELSAGTSSSTRWSGREEIRLLDAIEQYGFGNWQDISKHIENRNPAEAKEEFVRRYVDGAVGQISWSELSNNSDKEVRRHAFPEPIDHTIPCDEGPLSPSLTQRLPPLDISQDEMLQLGYMPFRDDYEKEFDNDAEKLVSQLSFSHDDDEVDLGLKLGLVDMYSRRLRERARRKRIIRDYQLVCKFFKKERANAKGGVVNGEEATATLKDTPKRFQGYERHLQEKLRPFAQFYNSREFENLIRNLIKEKDLKLRLQELFKYRAAGITRPEECVEYERSRSGPNFKGKRGSLGTVEEEDGEEGRSHKKAMMQSPALIQQLLRPSTTEAQSNEGNAEGSGSAVPNPTPLQSYNEDFNSKSLESSVLGPALLPQLLEKGTAGLQPLPVPAEASSFPQNVKQRGLEDQYTANFIPGADLLAEDELDFCKKIRLLPNQFLAIKFAHLVKSVDIVQQPTDENSTPGMNPHEWEQLLHFFKSKEKSQSEDKVS